MKKSSYLSLGAVLLVFAIIEGVVLVRTLGAPRTFSALESDIQGVTLDVRSPVQGVVTHLAVQQGQRVTEGQELFTLTRLMTDRVTQEQYQEELSITALQAGMVTDLKLVLGMLVQADNKVAEIVNNSPEVLYINAKLAVNPNDVPSIRPMMEAYVRADFLAGGRDLRAVVASVSPVYEGFGRTLDVRLRLVEQPPELKDVALGMPVQAWVREAENTDGGALANFFSRFLPTSEAQQ